MANRLREYYDNTVFNGLKDKFEYKNVMEVPKLEKIVIVAFSANKNSSHDHNLPIIVCNQEPASPLPMPIPFNTNS